MEQELADLAQTVLSGLLAVLPDQRACASDFEDAMAPDVVVWSPTLHARSRDEVIAALRSPDDDDTLTEVQVTTEAADVVGPRVYLEWRLTGRFTNPCFVDDDLLIEPTGRLVEASGVQVATFRTGRLIHVNCYYDDLALLEQLVTG